LELQFLLQQLKKGENNFKLDVKSGFLNGELKEEVYVEQPQDFGLKSQEEKIHKS